MVLRGRMLRAPRTSSRRASSRLFSTSPAPPRLPVTWTSLLATTVAGAGITAYYVLDRRRARIEHEKRNTRVVGKALLGGDWELVDCRTKELVTNKTVLDGTRCTHALLYFGFTHCPDICPAEMLKISEIVDTLAAQKIFVLPVFITCDPTRDSVYRCREYVKDFHPDFVSLTGTSKQIDKACKAFRVYHSDAFDPDKDNDGNEKDEDSEYLVDHSIVSYLVDDQGEFLDFYTQLTDAKEASRRVAAILRDGE